MSELRDCPFCKSTDIDPAGWMDGANFGPQCQACGATAEATEAWNTRATDAELERLRELLRDIKEWEIGRADREPLFVLPTDLRARIQAAIDEARKG